jgi:hypothetical protein
MNRCQKPTGLFDFYSLAVHVDVAFVWPHQHLPLSLVCLTHSHTDRHPKMHMQTLEKKMEAVQFFRFI